MKEERKVQQSDIDQAKAVLKPIAGLRPEFYVPALYALAILCVLFLILILPGIRSNGSYLVFQGAPFTAEVRIDGAYKGSTSTKVFASSGERELEIGRAGYTSHSVRLDVRGRIFGSLFFPRLVKVDYALSPLDPNSSLEKAFEDYAAWSMTGKPSALYQFPLVLSEAAWDRTKTGSRGGVALQVREFASDALASALSPESARDGLRSVFILQSGGSLSSPGILGAARTLLSALGSERSGAGANGAVWLRDMAPKLGTSWTERIDAAVKAASAAGSGAERSPRPSGTVRVAGQDYIIFSPGTLRMLGRAPSGSKLGYLGELESFGMASTEVTNAQWAEFLAANPAWKSEGASASTKPPAAQAAAAGVSWKAAAAYCAWKSTASGPYEVILPSESMWEAAASSSLTMDSRLLSDKALWSNSKPSAPAPVGSKGYAASGLADLFGNVWEWTSSPYFPYPAFAAQSFFGVEKSVRGGSWGNAAGSIELGTRGGMEPDASSPFLGFRTAIRKR